MKRNIIIGLIAACVGITLYINEVTQPMDPAIKSRVEAAILEDPRFPARPVWWENDTVLAVGVLKEGEDHSADAVDICKWVREAGIKSLLVEMYDLLTIQNENKWNRIGAARCDVK
ncbi:MAG: hypothetical protein OIF57_09860 [Marinobacterium sp.]|nr:hypothetical protein [Marinobacterium sp.]